VTANRNIAFAITPGSLVTLSKTEGVYAMEVSVGLDSEFVDRATIVFSKRGAEALQVYLDRLQESGKDKYKASAD